MEMAQTQLEQAVVKAVGAEQSVKGALPNQLYAPENGEQIGKGDRENEPLEPFREPNPGFAEMKAAAFDIREEGFNGTITNDKFCLSRIAELQLSWRRGARRR